jgi:hypothetical protein
MPRTTPEKSNIMIFSVMVYNNSNSIPSNPASFPSKHEDGERVRRARIAQPSPNQSTHQPTTFIQPEVVRWVQTFLPPRISRWAGASHGTYSTFRSSSSWEITASGQSRLSRGRSSVCGIHQYNTAVINRSTHVFTR